MSKHINNLTQQDLKRLEASYLTPEIATAAQIRRVDSVTGAERRAAA
jgi:hypothetical protein